MTYSWNVYKIFKNGKRAKAPIGAFECAESDLMDYFQNEVRKNYNFKLPMENYKIIRSDLSQEREIEQVDQLEEENKRLRIKFLSLLIKKNGVAAKANRSINTALIFSADTNWNWQWAAIEKGTSNYIQGLSPQFDTHREAETWIENQISMIT